MRRSLCKAVAPVLQNLAEPVDDRRTLADCLGRQSGLETSVILTWENSNEIYGTYD
jgi:hypothetical protein